MTTMNYTRTILLCKRVEKYVIDITYDKLFKGCFNKVEKIVDSLTEKVYNYIVAQTIQAWKTNRKNFSSHNEVHIVLGKHL